MSGRTGSASRGGGGLGFMQNLRITRRPRAVTVLPGSVNRDVLKQVLMTLTWNEPRQAGLSGAADCGSSAAGAAAAPGGGPAPARGDTAP